MPAACCDSDDNDDGVGGRATRVTFFVVPTHIIWIDSVGWFLDAINCSFDLRHMNIGAVDGLKPEVKTEIGDTKNDDLMKLSNDRDEVRHQICKEYPLIEGGQKTRAQILMPL
jgi:hypothetical protein